MRTPGPDDHLSPPNEHPVHHNHKNPFASSQDEFSVSNPAPLPYQSTDNPFTSNLRLSFLEDDPYSNYLPAPAYTSTSRLNILEEINMDKRKEVSFSRDESPIEEEKPKPSVHYPENVKPFQFATGRADSPGDFMASRQSSLYTEDEDSEDYDWSGEDDLVDEEAKFEKQMGIKTKSEGWGFMRVIAFLFSSLVGSTFMAGVLITPPILVHFYWYKPHPTEHRRYVNDNIQAWLFWVASNLVISWWLALIIDLVPIVARFIIAAAWGHVSEFVRSRIEMYNSVKDNIKPALYAASGWVSWTIIFGGIYKLFNSEHAHESRAGYTYRLSQVVEFMFFFALVYSISRMLSHSIAFSFHRTAYRERVAALEEALHAIEKLRDYRPRNNKSGTRTPMFKPNTFSEKEHAKRLANALKNVKPSSSPSRRHGYDTDTDDTDDYDNTHKSKQRRSWFEFGIKQHSPQDSVCDFPQQASSSSVRINEGTMEEVDSRQLIPQIPTSRPMTPSNLNPHRYPPYDNSNENASSEGGEIVKKAAKVIGNAVLHDARNIRGENTGDEGALSWDVSSSREAKRLARSIYHRLKDRRRRYLIPSDFYPAFPTEEAANEAFRVFDKDNNGDISRAEIKTKIVKAYKERRFLSRSMRDVGEALKTLHRIILFFGGVILFFISLSIFGVEVGSSLTSVYSIGVAASFIFKNTASSAFDAIMFLFVTHPYDTGDRCFIDNENLVVKKVGLFATVFARSDGTETYYFNSQLFNKFITNVRRSDKTFENLSMQVTWRTPLAKLDALEKYLNDWISTEENRWYQPSTNINLQHIVCQRYLELTIGIGHNGNWQDWGLRNTRRTAFHAAAQHYCRELGIIGYEAPQPIVYADPITKTYSPDSTSTPMSPRSGRNEQTQRESVSMTPQERASMEAQLQEIERSAKNMKPNLGFLPPLANRETSLRARKSRRRKAVFGGMDMDG